MANEVTKPAKVTKNNLDVGAEAPHHTKLANRYKIEDNVYDLTQIAAAVKGEQSNDDWNARTMGDRLEAIKSYLKDQDAEKVDETENTAGDGVDASQLRSASTRDKPLHGHVDDLKAPY